jgi:hypothetical protein
MGIRIFSSGSKTCTPCGDWVTVTKETKTTPNPNPFRFELKNVYNTANYMMIVVNYPDATTYEGDKVLIYKRSDEPEVLKMLLDENLDPHFLEDSLSPIARFPSSDEGMKLAFKFIKEM